MKSYFKPVNNSLCSYKKQSGGIMSLCPLKKGYCELDRRCDNFVAKAGSKGLGEFKGVLSASEFLPMLIDDASPLRNEYLLKVEVASAKLELKKRDLLQDYHEDKYKELVNDLKEKSDDVFDSKGDDISDKDFLENEKFFGENE